MTSQFDIFLSQLKPTNATLDYFSDFVKAGANVSKIAVKLNQLNYLLGKANLEKAVTEIYEENPQSFEVLGILIAVRRRHKKLTLNSEGEIVELNSFSDSPDKIVEFINDTGLGDVFRNKQITNLVDYVFGVEIGLDTNSRKNRGGDNMSKAVSRILDKHGISYDKEVRSTEFPEIITLGADIKQFDFVIRTASKTYLIEVNFYNSGGSKLNEVARAYSDLAPKINQYENYEFIWITDGQGWLTAKNKLEEAFNIIPGVYNLATLQNFIIKIKKE